MPLGRLCARCRNPHRRYRDKEHRVFASYCHSCHAEYMREKQRPKDKAEAERRQKQLEKMLGRSG